MGFSTIGLSLQTVARWIDEGGISIERHLESEAANFTFFALVIDEGTDATDTAQLDISIRGIDNEYSNTEEIAFLVQLKDKIDLLICMKW